MEAEIAQAGVALVMITLCGGNIFLLLSMKTAIRSQTKRIDALSESLKKKSEGAVPKKSPRLRQK